MALPASPWRHWRSPVTEPLPTATEALGLPFRAFPSWFLRIECDRCGKATMLNEAHTGERRGTMLLRILISRMRHDGCGGRAGRAAHRHRRRLQPAGAADRADRRLTV
jgi:hypothetical protein